MSSYKEIQKKLMLRGINFEAGLSTDEIERIQKKFSLTFPLPLRNFLAAGLPKGEGFPDWRHGEDSELQTMLDLPLNGLIFDLENNNFWMSSLAEKPQNHDLAKKILIEMYEQAPKLIPVYLHRYMPSISNTDQVPVISVHQSDIIYYGSNLENYLDNEFFALDKTLKPYPISLKVPFWSELIESN